MNFRYLFRFFRLKFPLLISIILISLVVFLSSCTVITVSPVPFPPSDILRQAIELQLRQSQTVIHQHFSQFHPAPLPAMQLNQIKITQIEPMTIQELPAFHVQGFYHLQITRPDSKTQHRRNPFDVYLQSQKRGQTWRLARPYFPRGQTSQQWLTYLIE